MRTNCLFWALGRIRERWRAGCGLWIEPSRYGWWPHFALIKRADDEACECFTTDKKYPRWCPPLIFKGYVKKGKR